MRHRKVVEAEEGLERLRGAMKARGLVDPVTLPCLLADLKGVAASEEAGSIYAADFLAWARRELVHLYQEVKDRGARLDELEVSDGKPLYRNDEEMRLRILNAMGQNLIATTRVAQELRRRTRDDYRLQPEFQRLWTTLVDFVRETPGAADDLDRRLREMEAGEVEEVVEGAAG